MTTKPEWDVPGAAERLRAEELTDRLIVAYSKMLANPLPAERQEYRYAHRDVVDAIVFGGAA